MLYLLDANVLIDASRDYYPFDQVPEFWEWLVDEAKREHVKVPYENHQEIVVAKDHLSVWEKSYKSQILLNESVSSDLVQKVIVEGYAEDLNDEEIEKIGKDPILIAYALADIENRTVVTTEASKPRRRRANRHLPDVCRDFGVKCCGPFEYTRKLNFTTQWKTR